MKTLLKQEKLYSLMQSKGDDPYSLAKRMRMLLRQQFIEF